MLDVYLIPNSYRFQTKCVDILDILWSIKKDKKFYSQMMMFQICCPLFQKAILESGWILGLNLFYLLVSPRVILKYLIKEFLQRLRLWELWREEEGAGGTDDAQWRRSSYHWTVIVCKCHISTFLTLYLLSFRYLL